MGAEVPIDLSSRVSGLSGVTGFIGFTGFIGRASGLGLPDSSRHHTITCKQP